MKKFAEVMFDDLTAEQLKELPPGAAALWIMRPTREKIENKSGMYLRTALIIGAVIFFHSWLHEFTFLLGAWLLSYEFAYFNLRREKAEQDYGLAREEYVARAQEIDQ
jgi:hypothetical protein